MLHLFHNTVPPEPTIEQTRKSASQRPNFLYLFFYVSANANNNNNNNNNNILLDTTTSTTSSLFQDFVAVVVCWLRIAFAFFVLAPQWIYVGASCTKINGFGCIHPFFSAAIKSTRFFAQRTCILRCISKLREKSNDI